MRVIVPEWQQSMKPIAMSGSVLIDPSRILFLVFFAYACSGPAVVAWRRFRRRPANG